MTTLKSAGASCPKCKDACPAEYAQQKGPARWACHVCGAAGELVTQKTLAAADKKTPAVKPHWSQKRP